MVSADVAFIRPRSILQIPSLVLQDYVTNINVFKMSEDHMKKISEGCINEIANFKLQVAVKVENDY